MPTALTPDDFPWFDYRRYSFSLGVEHAGWGFLSGHSASAYDTTEKRIVVRGGMAEQTRTAYAKAERILAAGGFTLDDVVHVVENVTVDGIAHYPESAGVRDELFGSAKPTVSTVVVRSLLRPAALIEVELTACRDAGSRQPSERGSIRQADGIVYLPTIQPFDQHGELVGEGDPAAQVRQIFENARRMLRPMGLDTDRIVKTLEMVHPDALAGYKATGRVRKEFLGPVYPAAAGILQPRVAQDERVLISYDVVAVTRPAVSVKPGWERYSKLTYSPAVAVGDFVFLSGQAALDPATERAVHPGDIVAQAEYTYRNIITVLEEAGLGPQNLIRTVEYVTPRGLDDYRQVAEVRRGLLTQPWPASTGIVCEALLRPEFLIEVDPTAMRPQGRRWAGS